MFVNQFLIFHTISPPACPKDSDTAAILSHIQRPKNRQRSYVNDKSRARKIKDQSGANNEIPTYRLQKAFLNSYY